MNRPKLLDLYCCEGGAGMGYHRAGFDVYGIDINPQSRYPFAFHQGDAIVAVRRLILGEAIPFTHKDGRVEWLTFADFAAIHASPPCQAYSITKHSHSKTHPDLLAPTREALIATGKPYVVENVVGAPLEDPMLLCGSMFGLRATDTDGTELALQRHRLFESNVWLMSAGGCAHDGTQIAGAYGGGSADRAHAKNVRRGGYTPAKEIRAELLGIDWMTLHGLSQSLPPAYTEFIGRQLADHLATVPA